VSGANPPDSVLEAFFENSELLLSRALFFGLDAAGLIAPEPTALITDVTFSADRFNTGPFTIFENRQLLFFRKTRATL
jgi:hypothetical protein